MSMTDEELDRDWKPSGRRPQSTIARSFSQELMDIFRIENSVADLDEQVDKRKQHISVQNHELEALEARIREMEMRLKPQGTGSAPSSTPQQAPGSSGSPRPPQRAPVSTAFSGAAAPAAEKERQEQRAGGGVDKYGPNAGSRPGTARQGQQPAQQGQRAVPGALPPTPTASESEEEDEEDEDEEEEGEDEFVPVDSRRRPPTALPLRSAHGQPPQRGHPDPHSGSQRLGGRVPHASGPPSQPSAPCSSTSSVKSSTTPSAGPRNRTFADYVLVNAPDEEDEDEDDEDDE